MVIRRFPWIRQSLVIWHKELRIEFRTRFAYRLTMFAVTIHPITISFSVAVLCRTVISAALVDYSLFRHGRPGRTLCRRKRRKPSRR